MSLPTLNVLKRLLRLTSWSAFYAKDTASTTMEWFSSKKNIALSKHVYRPKKTMVLGFLISCPLFSMTPEPVFAHSKSCELGGNTAEAIMTFNACKANAQAAQLSGNSKKDTHHALEDEINRLRAENIILSKQLNDVRGVLFQLLQKLTTE